ncbi:MAG TPA: hypothetical protein VMU02_02350, partial [bacterium]|nr:hypothetical protein [bacterium]
MNKSLVRKVFYPGYRMLRRDSVLAMAAEMRRVDKMTPDEVRAYQWQSLRRLLDHAAHHVPYYRKVFKQLGATPEDIRTPEDFQTLPVLRKQDVRDNLRDLIAETDHGKFLYPEETGGSTGQNLFFYVDRQAGQARKAAVLRMNEWLGIQVGDRKAALWGSRFRGSKLGRLERAVKIWFDNTIEVSAYEMDQESIARSAKKISRFKPDLLLAFPSSLYHFAQSTKGTGVWGAHPKVILSSGETLYEWQRTVIEDALGGPVYDHYGCCEFSAIARECRLRDGLHIVADRVYVEAVPMVTQPSGEDIRELVITGLHNYGMPFIRYAIEDTGSITWEHCSCGLPLPRLKSLSGRVYDIVQAPNGNFLDGTFWGHVLKEGVEKFQVTQDSLEEVKIAIVPNSEF